jgi:hypothetical protein
MVEIITLDLQLALLTGIDDENRNCLHYVCMNADFEIAKEIINACNYVTDAIIKQNEQKIDFKNKFESSKYMEPWSIKNVLLNLIS